MAGVLPLSACSASRAEKTDMNSESWCTIGCGRQSRTEAWMHAGRVAFGWAADGARELTWWQSMTTK
eukprot:9875425-Prorocentrum_lima.AAC.1